MYKRQIKRIILILLTAALLLSCCPAAVSQTETDALTEKLSALKAQYDDALAEADRLREKHGSYAERKTSLDTLNSLTLQEIRVLTELKGLYNDRAEKTAAVLGSARKNSERLLDNYRARLRVREEAGRYCYLGLLLGADSIPELLTLFTDIVGLIESDRRLEAAYKASVRELTAAMSEYGETMALLTGCLDELEALTRQLKAGQKESSSVMAELGKALRVDPSAASALDGLSYDLERELREKMGSLVRPSGQRGITVEPDSLLWPVDSVYITSLPGGRKNPVTGKEGAHDGADVGCDYGSPVYAAEAGRVELSRDGWNGGYGSFIVISHESGVETLYAHLSIRSVSEGTEVTKGQLVGYTGDSGRATGPHLHYELWEGSSRADPLDYYPHTRFSYSPTA